MHMHLYSYLIHGTEPIWGRWSCKLFTVPAVRVEIFNLYPNLGTPPIFNILQGPMLYLVSISMVVISNTAQISFTSLRLCSACIAKDIVRTLLLIRKTGARPRSVTLQNNSYIGSRHWCPMVIVKCPYTLQRQFRLYIPFLGIARPQPQFPHSCVLERFIYFQDQSTYFLQQNRQTQRNVVIYNSLTDTLKVL